MSFLLDTDICSAYLKNDPAVVRHVMLHFGGLSVSAITVGELFVWARRRNAPAAREVGVRGFLGSCRILGIHWPELDEDLSIAGLMAGVDWQSA